MGRDGCQLKQSDPEEMIWLNSRLTTAILHLLIEWVLFVLGWSWAWDLISFLVGTISEVDADVALPRAGEDLAPSFSIDYFLSPLVIILGVDTDVALPRVRAGLGPHPLQVVESVSGC